jgi:hypothetical protein
VTSTDSERLQALPPLREVIAKYQLSANKALGQNFLLDLNLTGRIARAGGPLAGEHIIEVGPGPGGLTRALLAEGAGHVTVIERDFRVLPALAEIAAAVPGRLTIIEGDALATDYAALAGTDGARIVANLPYNIATPLLTGWLAAERPPGRPHRLAGTGADRLRRAAARLHAAAQGDVVGCAAGPQTGCAMRIAGSGFRGHSRRLRSAAENVALEPEKPVAAARICAC